MDDRKSTPRDMERAILRARKLRSAAAYEALKWIARAFGAAAAKTPEIAPRRFSRL